MATVLPTYNAGVALPGGQGGVPAAGFGASAAAMRGFGTQVERTANTAGYLIIRRQKELEQLQANDYVATNFANLTDQQHTRFFQESENAPAGAKGFTQSFMDSYDEQTKGLIEGAPNDEAKARMKERVDALRGVLHNNALVFERDAGKQMRQENVAASVNKLSNIAIGSPEMYGDLRAQVEDTVNAYKGDMTAAEFVKVKEVAHRQLATSALSGLVDKDPQAALGALDTGKFDDILHPDDKIRLQNAADTEIKRQEATARAEERARQVEARAAARAAAAAAREQRMAAQFDARSQLQDELAARADGKTINPDLEKQIIGAGFKPQVAEAMINHLHAVTEEGSIGRSLATLPKDDIQAAVAKAVPAGPGYAEEAKSQERLKKVADDVLARREKDPAAEAARAFPEIEHGLASGDATQVSAAVRRSLDVQRDVFGLGGNQLRPLTKPAAADIVDKFKGAGSADDKLALLNSVTIFKNQDGTLDFDAAHASLHQLEEAGLPTGTDVALQRQLEGNVGAARAILGAVALNKGDVPSLTQGSGVAVADAIKQLRDAPDTGSAVDAKVAAVTGQPDDVRARSRTEDVIDRLTRIEVAGGADAKVAAARADKIVHGDGPKLSVDTLAHVHLPAGADPEAARAGFEAMRGSLDLSYLRPTKERIASLMPLGTPPGDIEGRYNLELRKFDQWAESVRQNGVFINHGDGFTLVPQAPGAGYAQEVPGPDGKPRVFSLDEVLAAKPPEVQGGQDWGFLGGGSGEDTLGTSPRRLLTAPQAIQLMQGGLREAHKAAQDQRDINAVFGEDPSVAKALLGHMENLGEQVKSLQAEVKKPRVKRVVRDEKGLITHLEESQ